MSKKQLILQTAAQLFAEKGLDATSVQQITDACSISKGAFYLSFKSKDELIMAIIDYFMQDITTRIDRSVKNSTKPLDMLYYYYYQTFSIIHEHFTLASVFFKEQNQFDNEQLIAKVAKYEVAMDEILEYILQNLYPEAMIHYLDLKVIVRGFISGYADFMFHRSSKGTYDIHALALSLVEKTTIIAEHTTTPFLTKEMLAMQSADALLFTKDHILHEAQLLHTYLESDLSKQSVAILTDELQQSTPKQAIIEGMLANLRKDERCQWFCFLVENYQLSMEN